MVDNKHKSYCTNDSEVVEYRNTNDCGVDSIRAFLTRYVSKHPNDQCYINCLQQLIEMYNVYSLHHLLLLLMCNAYEMRRVVCKSWSECKAPYKFTSNYNYFNRNNYCKKNAHNDVTSRECNAQLYLEQFNRFYSCFSAELIAIFRCRHTNITFARSTNEENDCCNKRSENDRNNDQWSTMSVLEMVEGRFMTTSHESNEQHAARYYTTGCKKLDMLLGLHDKEYTIFTNAVKNNNNTTTNDNKFVMYCNNECNDVTNTNKRCSIPMHGFRSGWVYEIYGEAGSGKTQLVLQVLLQQRAYDVGYAALTQFLANQEDALVYKCTSENNGNANTWHTLELVRSCKNYFNVIYNNKENINNEKKLKNINTHIIFCRPSACIYLVSEEIPVARLETLAKGAVKRIVHFLTTHSELTKLPSLLFDAMQKCLTNSVNVNELLQGLQIKPISSLRELHELITNGVLTTAIKLWGNGAGVVVIDSIANAVMRDVDINDDSSTFCDRDREEYEEEEEHEQEDIINISSVSVKEQKENMNNKNVTTSNAAQICSIKPLSVQQSKKLRETALNVTTNVRQTVNAHLVKRQRSKSEHWKLLEEFAVSLKKWAVEENVCVLVTNQVRAIPTEHILHNPRLLQRKRYALNSSQNYYSHDLESSHCTMRNDASVVPALSFTWASVPHARLLLRRYCNRINTYTSANNTIYSNNNVNENGKTITECEREMILMHCPSAPPFQLFFQITNDGIDTCEKRYYT